jgi:hypothetical protein
MSADRFLHFRCGHSEKVSHLTDLEYRVWTQYLLSADDFGVMRASAVAVQADNDHLANRPARLVQRALDTVIHAGLVHTFEHQTRLYLYQRDWQSWQKIGYPRSTGQPKPNAAALATCDPDTQQLFSMHPGGEGKRFLKRSRNIPEMAPENARNIPETFPLVRATRELANGKWLMANGSEGGPGETTRPLANDDAFAKFRDLYPEDGRKGGPLVEQDFLVALQKAGGVDPLIAALRNHMESEQWQHGKIPGMDKWLREERWRQRLNPPKVEAKQWGTWRPPNAS